MLVILFISVFEYTYFSFKSVFEYLPHSLPWPYFHIYIIWSLQFSDSDFAGCQDSRKSTSGYIYMLVGGAVSWHSVKQTIVSSSTMDAMFVAYYEASNQGIWLKNFVIGLGIVEGIERPFKIYCDNKSTILYFNNNRSSLSQNILTSSSSLSRKGFKVINCL